MRDATEASLGRIVLHGLGNLRIAGPTFTKMASAASGCTPVRGRAIRDEVHGARRLTTSATVVASGRGELEISNPAVQGRVAGDERGAVAAPKRMAAQTAAPAKPPTAAVGVKACVKISA